MTRRPNRFSASRLFIGIFFIAGLIPSASAQELTRRPATALKGGAYGHRAAGAGARRGRLDRRSPMKIRAREGDTIKTLAERFNVPAETVAALNNLSLTSPLRPRQEVLVPSISPKAYKASATVVEQTPVENISVREGKRSISLTDGSSIEADEIWDSEQGVRYRRGGVTFLVARERVRAIERAEQVDEEAGKPPVVKLVEVSGTRAGGPTQPVWIYLVGGARVEADEVTESAAGAWYRRGNLSIFLERSRIERIEREAPPPNATDTARAWTERGWSTGNAQIDKLIRENGTRYGVDPYLIFCVMEQESHFHPRVVSPKGARGLMQLMPGTGARFGVRNAFDPSQNIMGGTRYLKQLLENFNGRVDLVLAGYNAGEGAVMKYGRNVPPYRETRDYVKKISARYKQGKPINADHASAAVASRLR